MQVKQRRLFLLHDECLQRPVDWQEGDRLIFLWDQAYFIKQGWSLKRRVFIYECLVSLQAEIYATAPQAFWQALLTDNSISVYSFAAIDPLLQAWLAEQASMIRLELLANPSHFLLDNQQPSRLKRFSHFWPGQAAALGLPGKRRQNKRGMHK